MGLPESASIGRIAVDPTNSGAGVRRGGGPRRPLGRAARPLPHGGRRQDAGSSCSRRRTRPPARSTSRSTRRTRRSSTRRCGTTSATTARASTAASAPGLFRSKDGGDTWKRLENIVDPLPAYDTTQTGLKRTRASAASASRSRRATRTGSTSSSAIHDGPDKGFYCSDDGGDTLPRRRPRLPASERLPVVVRAHVGRPGGQEPHLQRRREPARVDRRRHDVDGDQRPARRPARRWTGTRDARRQPGDPDASSSATTAACTAPTPTASTARG